LFVDCLQDMATYITNIQARYWITGVEEGTKVLFSWEWRLVHVELWSKFCLPRERPTSDGAKRRPVAGRLGPERSLFAANGSSRERRVYLLANLQSLREG
jgi:hypothetical protein